VGKAKRVHLFVYHRVSRLLANIALVRRVRAFAHPAKCKLKRRESPRHGLHSSPGASSQNRKRNRSNCRQPFSLSSTLLTRRALSQGRNRRPAASPYRPRAQPETRR
jgi:hypothetical protein